MSRPSRVSRRPASPDCGNSTMQVKAVFGVNGCGGSSLERIVGGGPSQESLRCGRYAIFLSIVTGQKWSGSRHASGERGQSGGRWIINSAKRYSSYPGGTVIGLSLIPAVKSVVHGLSAVGGMTWTRIEGSPGT